MLTAKTLLGIDAGGTFTDFICVRIGETTTVSVHKTLSTPAAPEQAILNGIQALGLKEEAERGGLHIIHGSTVATNAALEGKNAVTAYVTNYGFGDTLRLARQTRPKLYALEFPAQPVPVPPDYSLETGGRVSAQGEILEPLSSEELELLLDKLRELKPAAVAINLLFSFLDDTFEKTIETAIKEAGLPVFLSRSSKVLPVYKEYERGIATWLNASLGPVVHGYLSRLQSQLGSTSIQIMQSNGETIEASKATDAAVRLLLSGPAGGLTAMKYLGRQIGIEQIISFDMGGTSTDVALLDGEIGTTSEGHIGPYPVAVPMVDMHTIGAGGGSIAFVDSGGMLQVGPRSAGAEPGPACYGLGGVEATVTDANLVLGRLVSDAKLAGDLQLSVEKARNAIAKIAEQIGLSIEETAAGIIGIANEHMAKAIREISVNRGFDPEEFVLASFGGAGGLHVCALAEAMQMKSAMVPSRGGVLSALGMLVATRGRQFTRTVGLQQDLIEVSKLEAEFHTLENLATQELSDQSAPPPELSYKRSVDICYRGQSYTLNVPWVGLAETLTNFNTMHQRRYGYALSGAIELVNICVNVQVVADALELPDASVLKDCNNVANSEVYGKDESDNDVVVIARDAMQPGRKLFGPAVVTEYSATTFVAPDWCAETDPNGNLRLQKTV